MRQLCMAGALFLSVVADAQTGAGVIINEIANSGTKKALYTGGEYVELLIVGEQGADLGGWYLTDLSSPSGTAKDNEGSVRFSDKDGSVFRNVIPRGTYVLVCFGGTGDLYGAAGVEEDVSLADGNNRITVFAYRSADHIEPGEGTIQFTGKDNIALLSAWEKNALRGAVAWGGSSSWTGSPAVELPQESLENGELLCFVPRGASVADFLATNPAAWESTGDTGRATPGRTNAGVDDAPLQKK